jgi:hypothetical protein
VRTQSPKIENTPRFSNVYQLRDYLVTKPDVKEAYEKLVKDKAIDSKLDKAIKIEMSRLGFGDLQ